MHDMEHKQPVLVNYFSLHFLKFCSLHTTCLPLDREVFEGMKRGLWFFVLHKVPSSILSKWQAHSICWISKGMNEPL